MSQISDSNKTELNDFKLTSRRLCDKILTGVFVHSIIRIFQASHIPIKVFLSVFVLGTTSFASLVLIQSINAYFSYQVITTSRTIYETPTLFPKVTFCNVNPLLTRFAYSQRNSLDNLTSQDDLKRLAHDLSDVLLSCRLNYEKCTANDFVWSYDQKYGNCFMFNSMFESNGSLRLVDLKKSILSGSMYGLKIELYVNLYENLLIKDARGLGLIVRIDNSSYMTDHGVDGVLVGSGQRTDIVIQREFKSILPKPFSNCELELDSFHNGVNLFSLETRNITYFLLLIFYNFLNGMKVVKKFSIIIIYFRTILKTLLKNTKIHLKNDKKKT